MKYLPSIAALILFPAAMSLGAKPPTVPPAPKAANQTANDTTNGSFVSVNLDPHIQPPIIVHQPVPKGADPQQVKDALEARYRDILVDNQPLNRVIKPSDVVVYVVAPNADYAIYVLGRRLLTVNAAMATASSAPSPHALAVHWADQLQQALPLLCWRPPDQPEPTVPPHPPLRITNNLRQVGGTVGDVRVRGATAFVIKGIQPDGRTAVDRADELTRRLADLIAHGDENAPAQASTAPTAATTTPGTSPAAPGGTSDADGAATSAAMGTGPVQVTTDSQNGTATLTMGPAVITTVTRADAHANLAKSVTALADAWASALNKTLTPSSGATTG